MKKLMLTLLLAVASTNVSAMVPANVPASAEDELAARIRNTDLNDTEKNAIVTWMKDHKAVTATAALLALAGTVGLIDFQWNDSKIRTAISDFVANHGGTWTKNTVTNHPVITSASIATVALIIFAAYDLRKDADQSALKKLYASLTSKKETAEVVEVTEVVDGTEVVNVVEVVA